MSQPKILVIRRENIGDLICTTPLIRALRQQLPGANIQALVSSYNVPVLHGNPDLDEIHSYQKAKHRQPDEGRFQIYWERFKTVRYLRRQRFDWLLLPGGPHQSALRFAKMIAPKRVLIRDSNNPLAGGHEVERTCRMLEMMGLRYQTPELRLSPNAGMVISCQQVISNHLGFFPKRIFGIHISARKISQQWPVEQFIEFAKKLPLEPKDAIALYWAPGAKDDPQHPGDDEKAQTMLDALQGFPIVPLPTTTLDALIASMACCSTLFCADGGAMHVAAGLGKPIVAMFGRSGPDQWGPWGVVSRVLQTHALDVRDISVDEAVKAVVDM